MDLPVHEGLWLAAWRLATGCRQRSEFYPYRKCTAIFIRLSVAARSQKLGEMRKKIEPLRGLRANRISLATLERIRPLLVPLSNLVSELELRYSRNEEAMHFVAILRAVSFALEHDQCSELPGHEKNVLFHLAEAMKGNPAGSETVPAAIARTA